MNKPFDKAQYENVLDVCRRHDVPPDLSEKVATILASDDVSQPNLGRSEEDLATIHSALPYLNNKPQGDIHEWNKR